MLTTSIAGSGGNASRGPWGPVRNDNSPGSGAVSQERRAWDSNPQPLSGHLISSQAAGQFAYPPGHSKSTTLSVRIQARLGILLGREGNAGARSPAPVSPDCLPARCNPVY